jgi:hypothetical protein
MIYQTKVIRRYLTPLIFRIACQIAHEHFFLAGDPEVEQQKKNGRQKQRPKRAERKRRADDKKERAEIHRMTNETVQARVNDALTFFHSHVGGCVRLSLPQIKSGRIDDAVRRGSAEPQ